MKFNHEMYFSCYSPKLKDFLINSGFKVYKEFLHIKTNKMCWVFEKTPEISIYLEQWSKLKNKKQSSTIE